MFEFTEFIDFFLSEYSFIVCTPSPFCQLAMANALSFKNQKENFVSHL